MTRRWDGLFSPASIGIMVLAISFSINQDEILVQSEQIRDFLAASLELYFLLFEQKYSYCFFDTISVVQGLRIRLNLLFHTECKVQMTNMYVYFEMCKDMRNEYIKKGKEEQPKK